MFVTASHTYSLPPRSLTHRHVLQHLWFPALIYYARRDSVAISAIRNAGILLHRILSVSIVMLLPKEARRDPEVFPRTTAQPFQVHIHQGNCYIYAATEI